MKQFFTDHADMLLVFLLSILLLAAYVYTRDEAIKNLLIMAVGGVIGMATKKARNVEVTGDESKVSVNQP